MKKFLMTLLTTKRCLNYSKIQNHSSRYATGNDKEEYTMTAARESSRRLGGCFGEELWKVALEPEC